MWDKTKVAAGLAAASLVGLLLAGAALVFTTIPDANKDLFNIFLMAIVGNTGTAFGFFLGGVAERKGNPPETPVAPTAS